MRLSGVSRKQAFLTHLTFSICVFVVLSYLIIYVWYPGFYFYIDGGVRGLITLFLVDVVLGPGLTLLVFKPGKKSLKFDMTVILLFQLSALTWGVDSVYSERSGGAVFYWGKISCLSQSDVVKMDMSPLLNGSSGEQKLAFLQRPETLEAFHEFVGRAFTNNSSEIYYYADRVVPLDDKVISELENYEIDMASLRNKNSLYASQIAAYMELHASKADEYKLLPLSCRYGNAIAVLDLDHIKVVEILDINIDMRAKDKLINLDDMTIKSEMKEGV